MNCIQILAFGVNFLSWMNTIKKTDILLESIIDSLSEKMKINPLPYTDSPPLRKSVLRIENRRVEITFEEKDDARIIHTISIQHRK